MTILSGNTAVQLRYRKMLTGLLTLSLLALVACDSGSAMRDAQSSSPEVAEALPSEDLTKSASVSIAVDGPNFPSNRIGDKLTFTAVYDGPGKGIPFEWSVREASQSSYTQFDTGVGLFSPQYSALVDVTDRTFYQSGYYVVKVVVRGPNDTALATGYRYVQVYEFDDRLPVRFEEL